MSLSDVTISREAWGDPRVSYLATLARFAVGIDGVEIAIARLARLWARCTHLGTDVVSVFEVNTVLMRENGAELLVAAGLGEAADDGLIRVRGRYANSTGKDRIGWQARAERLKAAGGHTRAAGAVRGANGTFAASLECPRRRSISPRVRFEVFKRDSFRCQYCGRAAPDVVLELEHIEPRSKGGSDEMFNLTTACWECNSGKSDRLLSSPAFAEEPERHG